MQSNTGRSESQKLGDGHASRSPHPPLPHQDSYDGRTHEVRSLPVLLPLFLLSFFLVGLFFICLLHCLFGPLRGNSSPSLDDHGLDPAILASFPTFPYDAVRAQREGRCGLECAVCISEFASGDVVRLLPVCCHAFHLACIDEWLSRHSSCPLCRSDLEELPDATAVQQDVVEGGRRDSHTIYVDEEDEGQAARSSKRHSRGLSIAIGRRRESVAEMEDDDRYTLRLTEAAEEQIAAYHMRAASR